MGNCWAANTWAENTWAENTWADVAAFVARIKRGLLMGVYP